MIFFETLVRMTAKGIRERNRAAIEAEILKLGKKQLAEVGAAALSLRSIAKELEMTPSALYRYIENRDELLTRLIVDSFSSLAAACSKAESKVARSNFEARFKALATALRKWSLAHPQEYGLIYGTPVPGFKASPNRTTSAGTRVFMLLAQLGADMQSHVDDEMAKTGRFVEAVDLLDTAAVQGLAVDDFEFLQNVTPEIIMNVLAAWNLIMGGLSAELFGHFGTGVDGAAMFDAWLDRAWDVARVK